MVDLKLIALQSGTFGRAFSLGAVSAARDGFPFKFPRTDGDQSHDGDQSNGHGHADGAWRVPAPEDPYHDMVTGPGGG
ncbi:hypothetical protein GCM10017744_096440 [Streptomyces antimycoticus]|uniref:Uncharacterized protein n=1 Tax=Streptomyces antimycoticus TaxID=68175 RepID=A0A4D4K0Z0_9ACTN|nr:hypothetical protein [Streptomyces antimycoticus]GDY39979.1 hypothetical protein SANT12839_008610 [Streptomyces antimycoticus]